MQKLSLYVTVCSKFRVIIAFIQGRRIYVYATRSPNDPEVLSSKAGVMKLIVTIAIEQNEHAFAA